MTGPPDRRRARRGTAPDPSANVSLGSDDQNCKAELARAQEAPRNFHPIANVFPLLVGHEFHELVIDIREHGLREAITLHPDGSILDGRNRYRACVMAKVEPRVVEWDGQGSEQAFVISKNLMRRHLSDSQRAMAAAKLADMPQGARSDLGPIGTMSAAQAADALNVGERSVKRAKAVRKCGSEKLVKAVEAGAMSVAAAARKARPLPTEKIKNRREHQRANARAEKQHKKKEQSERESLAVNFSLQARDLTIMLVGDPKVTVRPLAERTKDELDQAFRNFGILYKKLREAIKEVHQSHGDNVTVFPPKPWEPKP